MTPTPVSGSVRAETPDPFAVAARVADPELPVVSIAELGILRGAEVTDDGTAVVTITPTYSGCPAMDVIRADIAGALRSAGFTTVEIRTVFAPPWTTDWITAAGRAKLAEAGIAPPGAINGLGAPPNDRNTPGVADNGPATSAGSGRSVGGSTTGIPGPGVPGSAELGASSARHRLPLLPPPAPSCPHCGAAEVAEISRFGSTACMSLWRCLSCAEPFAHLKAH